MLDIQARLAGAMLLLAVAGAASAQPGMPSNIPVGPGVRSSDMSTPEPTLDQQMDHAAMNGANIHGSDRRGNDAGARPAKPEEVTLGAAIRDKKGVALGIVESVEADGAIVSTAAGKVKVPLEAFGMDKKGLVIGLSKKEFDALVQSATAAPAG